MTLERLDHLENQDTYEGEGEQMKELEEMNNLFDWETVKQVRPKRNPWQFDKIFNTNK